MNKTDKLKVHAANGFVDLDPDALAALVDDALADAAQNSVVALRLRRKLAKRDQKIAGLEAELRRTRNALAKRSVETEAVFLRSVERAVQEALCNVRMIPVRGIGHTAKIVLPSGWPEGDAK